ncbi:unnamed protein product [Soboliphyme baturini]|uniref:Cyclic nucleotide-binding domain-containing protein n=1 Tax=Soboliphyme baturini TaxID=241478 RepID=A0A183IHY8_9BILA|nr:unnamed protein product [Soboliphyme baturini]
MCKTTRVRHYPEEVLHTSNLRKTRQICRTLRCLCPAAELDVVLTTLQECVCHSTTTLDSPIVPSAILVLIDGTLRSECFLEMLLDADGGEPFKYGTVDLPDGTYFLEPLNASSTSFFTLPDSQPHLLYKEPPHTFHKSQWSPSGPSSECFLSPLVGRTRARHGVGGCVSAAALRRAPLLLASGHCLVSRLLYRCIYTCVSENRTLCTAQQFVAVACGRVLRSLAMLE